MIDKTYISNYRDYHIWGFKYKDEEGIEFWEYYGYPYEYLTGSREWFYNEKEIEQLVQMISRLYIYTLNHIKEVSSQVIFCKIKFQENIRGYIISDDWMNLTDEEEVYNFVHEQIRMAWEESERFDIEEAMSVVETAQAEIDLKYIPEMGYDNNIQLGRPYKMGDNRYNVDAMQKRNYACWKDWLIIGNEVYKKQEDCKSIRTIDLSNGKNEEFYSLDNTAYQRIGDFVIREDGAVMAVFWGEGNELLIENIEAGGIYLDKVE